MYGVTSSSKSFWYIWEYKLILSACGYILALLLISSSLHLLIQISALISSAFGKILAVLLRSSLLHLKIETHALKFSSYKLIYSQFWIIHCHSCLLSVRSVPFAQTSVNWLSWHLISGNCEFSSSFNKNDLIFFESNWTWPLAIKVGDQKDSSPASLQEFVSKIELDENQVMK